MKRGSYPPGVFEHTKDAPWNDFTTVKCNGCGRLYYPAERPRGILPDDMSYPPDTEHGREFSLCINCERERDICNECLETALTPDGRKPRAVDGCAACRGACKPCDGTGRVTVSDYPCGRRHGFGYCQQFSEPCDACDGTGIDKGEK
jgi:hypothetical protein